MHLLKNIIQNASHLRLLCGRAIECVSLIGRAVGAEKFTQDISEVMDTLLTIQTEGDDDPQLSYMISAWAWICQIDKSGFKSYLPFDMGLKAAAMKTDPIYLGTDNLKSAKIDKNWFIFKKEDEAGFGMQLSA